MRGGRGRWGAELVRVVVFALAASVATALAGAHSGSASVPDLGKLEACTSVQAGGPRLELPQRTKTVGSLPSQPYAVVVAGSWAFVTEPQGYSSASGLLSVLRLRPSGPVLERTVSIPGMPFGAVLDDAGRVLLVANYLGGLEALSTAALETDSGQVVLDHVTSRGIGDDEVVVDGDYAFVPEEESSDVAVYDLGDSLAHKPSADAPGHDLPREVGLIPVSSSPSGVALDRSASRLYVISEGGGKTKAFGELTAISVSAAEHDPRHSAIGTVEVGCDPARVALSASGSVAWVTDRGADTLLALRLEPADPQPFGPLLAAVRVGPEPVDVALVDDGAVALVTDSARFTEPDTDQTVAAINVADAMTGHSSLVGYLPAGAFPRQFGQAAVGPLLFTDFDSDDVRLIPQTDLAWLASRQPT